MHLAAAVNGSGLRPGGHQVDCIVRAFRTAPHSRIHMIGGIDAGVYWRLSQDEAIAGMERGQWSFYIMLKNKPEPIVIVATSEGWKFLACRVNGVITDDLLWLPECTLQSA